MVTEVLEDTSLCGHLVVGMEWLTTHLFCCLTVFPHYGVGYSYSETHYLFTLKFFSFCVCCISHLCLNSRLCRGSVCRSQIY